MDVVDTKKLENAIIYLQRITEGHNPVNNMPAEEDSILNNPNVIRCMYFIKDILEEIKRNEGYIGRRPGNNTDDIKPNYPLPQMYKDKKDKKSDFYLNPEDIKNFAFEDYYFISDICDELNRISTATNVKKCPRKRIWEYLVKKGYVEERSFDGEWRKVQTSTGMNKGIKTVERVSPRGNKYYLLIYPQEIQREVAEYFIKRNEGSIINRNYVEKERKEDFDRVEYNKKTNKPEGAGASWTDEEDERLVLEYREGLDIPEIAIRHKRTYKAIRARLKKHGLI